jgi:8-oxo-dGTP pyrophosphatase MutT (NUDIX family)
MTEDIHALIRTFLQQQSVIPLEGPPLLPPESFTKAGVVPFVKDKDGLRFYFMKPAGKIPELGESLFQLCKGTRMQWMKNSGWRDIKEFSTLTGVKETLVETALREGVEELGLVLSNISALFDLGGFTFSSATTGKNKYMWLFAAEMKEDKNFLPDASVAHSTGARKWLRTAEFEIEGRRDHRYIVSDIESRLLQHYKKRHAS